MRRTLSDAVEVILVVLFLGVGIFGLFSLLEIPLSGLLVVLQGITVLLAMLGVIALVALLLKLK